MKGLFGNLCAWRLVLVMLFGMKADIGLSADYQRYQRSQRLNSGDYLLKSFSDQQDAVFDSRSQVVDLGVNLGIGSDCGRVNFEGTMRSTLKNLLDAKYFGDIGRNIIGASPMLATCYMSPTWCAILKHTQLSANFLSQMRLSQCAIVDKYTDSRSDDYYRERQSCVRQKIADNGGDLEKAMDSCKNVFNVDLSNWAGPTSGATTPANKLIESSAKWAGLSGGDAERATDLVKAFVGDTVLSHGQVSVEYGIRQKALTPATHLTDLRSQLHKKLCDGILVRVSDEAGRRGVDQVVSDRDLSDLNTGSKEVLVDRQTIEALAYLPPVQRRAACKRLADTVALTVFTKDANSSLDILAVVAQNPHLPPERQTELEEKRRRLKDSVDLTLELERERNAPLRQVLHEINTDGERYRDGYTSELLDEDQAARRWGLDHDTFFDCSDGIMCDNRR